MYFNIFHTANVVFYVLLGISAVLMLQKVVHHIIAMFPGKKFADAKKDYKYAILIPARNESAVIDNLLKSIQEQDYNSELLETYVVVESDDDPTCEIVKRYPRTNIFVRKHLELKGKGHALDEVVQDIFVSGKKYDAYFIFDADNVLTPSFITEMNKCYDAGYQMANGYRNSKNWNSGWGAFASAFTMSMINTCNNKARAKCNGCMTVSGTGFYIASEVLEKVGGYKFFELTEDVELSLYCTVNNIKSTYNEYAIYFDEHPVTFKQAWTQRVRWVRGHWSAHNKYRKQLFAGLVKDKQHKLSKYEYFIDIFPIALLLGSSIAYCLFMFILAIIGSANGEPIAYKVWRAFTSEALSIYFFFVLYAAYMVILERRKKINLTFWRAVWGCLTFPAFMATYIPLAIYAVLKRKVEWTPIVHNVNIDTKK